MTARPAAPVRDLAEAHRLLRGDESFQFDLASRTLPPRREAPGWLEALGRILEALTGPLEIIFWIGVVAAVAALIYFIGRETMGARWRLAARKRSDRAAPADWRPDAAYVRLQLAEADRLAAQGLFAEAAHHLLLHSIQDVEDRRPRTVRPALTSREIGRLPVLPQGARGAFLRIAAIVEANLFGDETLGQAEFDQCRSAYQAFGTSEAWS